MRFFLGISRGIDRFSVAVGRGVSWLILAAILVSAANAISRKAFSISSNAYLELQWYLFGAAFMLAAAYTLQRNEHIRIDVVSGNLSKRTRDWIDLFGHVFFLMPFVLLMLYLLVPYVSRSVRNQEMSGSASGLIIWPAKAILLAGFALLFLQAVSEIIKRIGVIRGVMPDPMPDHHAHPAVEEQLKAANIEVPSSLREGRRVD